MPQLRFHCVMLPTDVPVSIQVAALMEAVMHHAESKEIKGHGQGNQKQKLCNLEPGRPFPCGGRRMRSGCHLSYSPSGHAAAMAPPLMVLAILFGIHE